MANAYNPTIWETEAGGWKVPGQPGLHSETLSLKNQGKTITSKHQKR
jgi:hypothetical protein